MGIPNVILRQFHTTDEFWDQAEKPEIKKLGRASRDTISGDSSFYGDCRTFDKAMELARYGWKQGLEQISPIYDRITARIGSYMPVEVMRHDVSGEFVDVGAMLQGNPEHMIAFDEELSQRKKQRIIKVVYNVSASGNIHSEIMMRRGSVACALIDALSRCGCIAELVVSDWAGSGGKLYGLEVPVKKAGEPLCIERVAFACGHPAMLRRVAFAVEETEPTDIREHFSFYSGYGRAVDAPKDRQGDLYFGAMVGGDPRWKSDNAAVQATLKMIADLGVIDAWRMDAAIEAEKEIAGGN
jgi:hypothetical protein